MNEDIITEVRSHLDAIALLIKEELENKDEAPVSQDGSHASDHPEKKE